MGWADYKKTSIYTDGIISQCISIIRWLYKICIASEILAENNFNQKVYFNNNNN